MNNCVLHPTFQLSEHEDLFLHQHGYTVLETRRGAVLIKVLWDVADKGRMKFLVFSALCQSCFYICVTLWRR